MQNQRYYQIFLYENKHWWYKGRRRLLFETLKSLPENTNKKILDFGCGPGSNINLLKKFGNVLGVDIESQAIEFCKQKGIKNIRVIKANENLPFPNEFFDIITCMDVLEHIEKEEDTLNELKRVLKKNGLLILTVPAFPFLWGELDERSHHLRRYEKEELVKILKGCDFKIQKVVYFNYLFFLPIVLIRLFQKSFLGKLNNWGVDPVVKNSFINNLLTSIFYIDIVTALKFRPPFGVSLFVLASRD